MLLKAFTVAAFTNGINIVVSCLRSTVDVDGELAKVLNPVT